MKVKFAWTRGPLLARVRVGADGDAIVRLDVYGSPEEALAAVAG